MGRAAGLLGSITRCLRARSFPTRMRKTRPTRPREPAHALSSGPF
jgi:hypothetical protein